MLGFRRQHHQELATALNEHDAAERRITALSPLPTPQQPTNLDAIRLGPADDATAVTAAQLRQVITRLQAAGHWNQGDADAG